MTAQNSTPAETPRQEEPPMPKNYHELPTPEEIARKAEELVTRTPPEVIERMKQRLEKTRYSTARVSGDLMTKRRG